MCDIHYLDYHCDAGLENQRSEQNLEIERLNEKLLQPDIAFEKENQDLQAKVNMMNQDIVQYITLLWVTAVEHYI